MKKRWTSVALVLVLSLGMTSVANAGLWANLWNSLGKAVEDYNADMIATGTSVNESLKNGKVLEAFDNYEKNMLVTCEHALANTKATYTALKDIVLWLPRQLKKIWDKFVAILQKIRDALIAMSQPGGLIPGGNGGGTTPPAPAAASTTARGSQSFDARRGFMGNFDFTPYKPQNNPPQPASNPTSNDTPAPMVSGQGLGDGFVESFKTASSLRDRLTTFTNYRGHVHTMTLWMNGLQANERAALEPNFQKVSSECALLEELIFDEVSASIEGDGKAMAEFTAYLKSSDAADAPILLGELATKIKRRLSMVRANAAGGADTAAMAKSFAEAMKAAGLR